MTDRGASILRIVYLSRSNLPGDFAAASVGLDTILGSSRRNNPPAGLTGALLFTGELFAQVLEGPVTTAESAFARIIRDPRHSEIVVLHRGLASSAAFGAWSMASAAAPPGIAAHPALAPPRGVAGETAGNELIALLRTLLLHPSKGGALPTR